MTYPVEVSQQAPDVHTTEAGIVVYLATLVPDAVLPPTAAPAPCRRQLLPWYTRSCSLVLMACREQELHPFHPRSCQGHVDESMHPWLAMMYLDESHSVPARPLSWLLPRLCPSSWVRVSVVNCHASRSSMIPTDQVLSHIWLVYARPVVPPLRFSPITRCVTSAVPRDWCHDAICAKPVSRSRTEAPGATSPSPSSFILVHDVNSLSLTRVTETPSPSVENLWDEQGY